MMRPVSITYEIPEVWKSHFDLTKDDDCLALAETTKSVVNDRFNGFMISYEFECDSDKITLYNIKWGCN